MNQVTQTSGEIPEQGFLSVVPSSRGHLEMQLSKGTGVPGKQNILQWIEQSMLCQQHPPTDKRYVTKWPLYTAPGLQKQEAIEKIIFSSLLSKPYLMNLELL